MKLVVFLSITATVLGFVPPSAHIRTPLAVMEMVATPLGGASMDKPDASRRVEPPPTASQLREQINNGDVMLDPSYKFSTDIALMGPAVALLYPSLLGLSAAAFHLCFAAFLWSQTNRVRLVFGKDSFELFNLSNDGKTLKEKPSNYVAGTVNRWRYDSIIDYGFFPSKDYPLMVYFKETDTPKEKWGNFELWGKFAGLFDTNSADGQPHFLPGLIDVPEFARQMEARAIHCKTLNERKPRKTYEIN